MNALLCRECGGILDGPGNYCPLCNIAWTPEAAELLVLEFHSFTCAVCRATAPTLDELDNVCKCAAPGAEGE